MGNNTNLDVVYVAVAVLTGLFGPSMAAIIGPYAVIFLSAIGGAAWSVGRRPEALRTFGNDAFFFTRLVITALMVTGGLAVWAERWIGEGTRNWSLPIIALVIGAVGDDWPGVGRWAAGAIRHWVNRKSEQQGE